MYWQGVKIEELRLIGSLFSKDLEVTTDNIINVPMPLQKVGASLDQRIDTTPNTGRRHRIVQSEQYSDRQASLIQSCVASKLEVLTGVGWCHNQDS